MLGFRCALQVTSWERGPVQFSATSRNVIVCAAKGPRPRYPRVWKANRRIGTISKSQKLVDSVKTLSNVKEEVYGALDAFVAWELEFPLITVKKALKILQNQRDWKRIIQVIKWMLSKGQGRTLGTYFTLLNALAEDGRMEEAEKLWTKLFRDNLESMPRVFFEKMIRIYYGQGMHEKIFETFADMEELGIRPTAKIVSMVGEVLVKQGMFEKNEKLKAKYPPPKWEYRYIKGKRVKIPVKQRGEEEESYHSDGGMLNEMQEEESLGPSDAVNDQELSENLEEDPGYVEEKSK